MFNPKLSKPVLSYEVAAEAFVPALRADVWTALAERTNDWWPAHFFNAPNPAAFVVEPWLGGRVYEDWGGGAGYLFGTVVVWVPGERMTWACELYPDWSGPGRSYVTFTLEDEGGGTRVRCVDSGYCVNAPQAADGLGRGWMELLTVHFKNYVARGS